MESGIEIPIGPSNTQGPAWVGLLILGIVLIAGGVMALTVMQSDSGFSAFDQEANRNFSIFGSVFVLVGVVFLAASVLSHGNEKRKAELRAQQIREEKQEEVEEIAAALKGEFKVKVRCRYCGSLNEENASKCDSCGASL